MICVPFSPRPAARFLRTFQSNAALSAFSTAMAPPSTKKRWRRNALRHGAGEGLDELRHEGRVDVRVRGLVDRRGQEAGVELRGRHLRVVEAHRIGREVTEEVEHVAPAVGVVEPDPVAALDVLHQVVAVDQEVAGEDVAHLVGGDARGVPERGRHGLPRGAAGPRGARSECLWRCGWDPGVRRRRPGAPATLSGALRGGQSAAARRCGGRPRPAPRRPGRAPPPWRGTSPRQRGGAAGSWWSARSASAGIVRCSVATPTEQVRPLRLRGSCWISPASRQKTAWRSSSRRSPRRASAPRRGRCSGTTTTNSSPP